MKVKFYKGPWHGKTKQMPKFEPQIIVHSVRNNLVPMDFSSPVDVIAPINFRQHIYRPVRMSDGVGGVAYSMHPDGSIFYVCQS